MWPPRHTSNAAIAETLGSPINRSDEGSNPLEGAGRDPHPPGISATRVSTSGDVRVCGWNGLIVVACVGSDSIRG